MKKILYFILVSLIVGGTWHVKSEDLFSSEDPFSNSIDPFKKKSRDFSVIDKTTDEKKCKDIVFKSIWGDDDYSVYIWRHANSDIYEIKSAFSSDVSNFMGVLDAVGYGAYDVKYRKDGRKHVKFRCENFANKLTNDTKYMLYIQ